MNARRLDGIAQMLAAREAAISQPHHVPPAEAALGFAETCALKNALRDVQVWLEKRGLVRQEDRFRVIVEHRRVISDGDHPYAAQVRLEHGG